MESNEAIEETLPWTAKEGRSLLLVWQSPQTRMFHRVGLFSQVGGGQYVFEYDASAKSLTGFFPMAEFPDFRRTYISEMLPAFFANRVMSHDRPSYSDYRGWLGLDEGADTPIEVLARTGGGRATDTFHLVDAPRVGNRLSSRFFVSGLRHVEDYEARLARVSVGDRLALRPQPDNPVNEKALLIDVETGLEIGWVPNWLVDEVHMFLERGDDVRIEVERINHDAPEHLRVLARIDAP